MDALVFEIEMTPGCGEAEINCAIADFTLR
jgi:hypothetical protein